MGYTICLDPGVFANKPTQAQTGKISKRIADYECSVTLEDLSRALAHGQTFVPATFFAAKRTQATFNQQQLVAVDIDKGNPSLDKLLQMSEKTFGLRPNILYASFSHTEENRKWRMIYALSSPLELPQEVKQISRYMASVFGGDTCVAECARLLYGTNKEVNVWHDNQFDVDTLLNLASAFRSIDTVTYAIVRHDIEDEQQLYSTIQTLPGRARGLLNLILTDIREWLANPAIKGSRYQAVFRASVHLSVLSFMPEWAVLQIVKNELAMHGHFDCDEWEHADRVDDIICKAVKWGKACDPRL